MKERQIKTTDQRKNAIEAIMRISLDSPYYITISRQKKRSNSQNARYWAGLQFHIDEVRAAIERVADYSGHTPLEIRKQIAQEMTPEHVVMLYAFKKTAVHDALKTVCGIDTSTKLGTKNFHKFDAVMECQMAEVLGEVNAYAETCK